MGRIGKRIRDKPEHWSDIVGMPDEWDLKNLTTLINNFMEEKFSFTDNGKEVKITGLQWTRAEVKDAKKSHQQEQNTMNEFGVKSKESEMRIGSAIPNVLWARISESYPTMFKDTKHFKWFMKKFPIFRVAQRF